MRNSLALIAITILFAASLTSCLAVPEAGDGIEANERRVFVTSDSFDGKMNSKTPDTLCNEAATAAKLERTYRAIVSTTAGSATERMVAGGEGIYKIDSTGKKVLVADNIGDLWDSSVDNLKLAIDIDEKGNTKGTSDVWTGTLVTGDIDDDTTDVCDNWTSNDGSLETNAGTTASSGSQWIANKTLTCDSDAHLYCISD